jgi:hypothetical protein
MVALLALLAVSPADASPRPDAPGAEQSTGIPGPAQVLDDIEAGWTGQDADLILKHFGSNKVTISVDGSGPGGAYSKDQGYYVFKELFKSTVTRKFVVVQIRKSNEEGSATFAIAERRYQRRDDGRQIRDKIYISLHLEGGRDGGRWVLDEIKSIR